MKRLTVWLIMLSLCAALWAVPARAEDDEDLSGWLEAQEAADAQIEWANMFGVEVDTFTQAKNITKQCKLKVSEGSRDRLTNGRVGSPWKYDHADAWIGIQLPDDVTPGAIRIEWMFDPTGYELTEYDASQNPIRTRTQDDTFPNIYTVYPLDPQTRTIQLKMTVKGQSVSNLAVYSEGVLPSDVQTWLPPVEKADMMVVSTHQDDEVIFLGGTIPYSDVVCNRPTVTMYMANCSRERRREALESLWEMGSRHYPEFVNLEDEKVSSVEKGVKLWGGTDAILQEIVARIRRYKPEVIVTQDLDGEYGHNQHKIVARAMQPAIEAAADPARFPESYNQYGAWQVKKLYIHLYKENQIRMDWNSPQDAFGGESLLDVAKRGMAKHASQTKYFKVRDGGTYDNALFGLMVTTVGPDVAKNDFFENIPYSAAEEVVEETAEPAADDAWEDYVEDAPEADDAWEDYVEEAPAEQEPLAEVTQIEATAKPPIDEAAFAPAESPTPVPEIVPGPAPEAEQGGGSGPLIATVAVAAALAGAGTWVLTRKPNNRKKKKRRRKGGKSKKAARKNRAQR